MKASGLYRGIFPWLYPPSFSGQQFGKFLLWRMHLAPCYYPPRCLFPDSLAVESLGTNTSFLQGQVNEIYSRLHAVPSWIFLASLGTYLFRAARDLGCSAFLLGIDLATLCLCSVSGCPRQGLVKPAEVQELQEHEKSLSLAKVALAQSVLRMLFRNGGIYSLNLKTRLAGQWDCFWSSNQW